MTWPAVLGMLVLVFVVAVVLIQFIFTAHKGDR